MFLRTEFNYDANEASRESALTMDYEKFPSMAQQSFKDECDINEIVRRFGLTGEMPSNLRMPVSGDFTGVADFHQAMNLVIEARDEFMRLPAEVRERFRNDPAELIAFLEDPANKDEAIELGLVEKPVEKVRDVVQAVDELAAVLKPAGGAT